MKMKKYFNNYLFLFLAALSVVVVGCNDDDGDDPVLKPSITGVSPAAGVVGATVTITGANLADATSVTFGDAEAQIGNNTATSVTTTVPEDAEEGELTITVTTAGGSATHAFTVTAEEPTPVPPTITSVEPAEMTGEVGSVVTVSGANLTGATVFFGDVEAEVDEASTDTELIFTVPEGAETGVITIKTADGEVETAEFTIVVVIPEPTISSVDPLTGEVGAEVTITGTNLEGATVFFGEVEATDVTATATEVTFTVPEGAETGVITVVTEGGEVETEEFTVTEPSNRFYLYDDVNGENINNHDGHDKLLLDRSNTEQVKEGENAIKVSFAKAAWGQIGFMHASGGMSTEGYEKVVFSVYGSEGAGQLNFFFRVPGEAQADIYKVKADVVAGEWTTFEFSFDELGSKKKDENGDYISPSEPTGGPFIWNEMHFQNVGGTPTTDEVTYYIDEIYFE